MRLVEIDSLTKNHGGLRPLRVARLRVESGEVVAVVGPDQQAASVLSDLLTGTTLPEAGEVRVEGRSTASLAGHDDWLAFLDRFGLVNERVVLLDRLTIAQNLAVPHTLDIDPMSDETQRKVDLMAAEVGLDPSALDLLLPAPAALTRLRVRLGRALAHDPAILIVEHPSVGLAPDEIVPAASLVRRVGLARRLATIVLSADRRFSRPAATRTLVWHPATGALVEEHFWRRWPFRW